LFYSHMGDALRIARERRGVQQQVLASRLHVSPPCLSKIECGRKYPAADIVAGYICALGCLELADLYCQSCPVAAARARLKVA